MHMGTTCMVEQMAITMQSRFCRFAPTPRWRNLGVYGMLDEIRHTQLDMAFSHDLLKDDQSFEVLTKKPVTASDAEMKRNPRSRSAQLRVLEKM